MAWRIARPNWRIGARPATPCFANEQVKGEECERCGTEIEKREQATWFLKITDYAERLLSGLDDLDWPEEIKESQRNWIGKSEGAVLPFQLKVQNANVKIQTLEVFTTRPDTLFGATYVVLAPEHELVHGLRESIENFEEVEAYVKKAKATKDIERMAEGREKTGVKLEGVFAINPGTNEEVPVYIADYVLAHYGTGAIMAVPAHDIRDNEFGKLFLAYNGASKWNLNVIKPDSYKDISSATIYPCFASDENITHEEWQKREYQNVLDGKRCYLGKGTLVNSGQFDGLDNEDAKQRITEAVGGRKQATYRLRDWSLSRQRYWGAPIPIVYDPDGKPHAVPDEAFAVDLTRRCRFHPDRRSTACTLDGAESTHGGSIRHRMDT
jgi:leucyl-tRNA synthetase